MAAVRKRKAPEADTTDSTKQITSRVTKRQQTRVEPTKSELKKRRVQKVKVESEDAVLPVQDSEKAPTIPPPSETIPSKVHNTQGQKRKNEDVQTTPQNKRFKNAVPPTPTDTPTRGARNLFDGLNLAATKGLATPSTKRTTLVTPPLTPESCKDISLLPSLTELPAGAQELVELFSAFVNATSLYMAHNGSNSSVLLADLLPLVTGSWKRRAVGQDDIRRLFGVLGKDDAPFSLFDEGYGRIVLEQLGTSAALLCLNAQGLNLRFEEQLKRFWMSWSKADNADNAKFVAALPLVEIEDSEDGKIVSRQTKGQNRLNRFQRVVAETRAKEQASKQVTVTADQKTSAGVLNRGTSLLDRIVAKKQLLSNQPQGPTREEADRSAALDRIEDVARVMELLAGGRPRVSFSTQMMIQHLQNSLRSPISKEDAERCLDIMAGEIMPSFVTLINSGSVRGVVVTRAGKLGAVELRRRLDTALGASR